MKPGPDSKVTVELVRRVSNLVAKGIPIRVALEGEPVTPAAYKKHLQRHSELAAIQAAAKIRFLDVTTDLIASKPGPLLRWLLERRFPHVFCRSPKDDDQPDIDVDTDSENEPQSKLVAGVPESELAEAQRYAQNL
ncbi:MAG TPA: hypothetical protein VH280_07010 [Verrucomicrobiae bacterium]|jgi:hypothetical protein|nr:hypothetical protein [Verrucomicrobiae bacterium]